jgi:uncharacterized membrane protein YhiD involved in acid resistance
MGMRRERTKKIIQRGCGRRTTVVVAKGSTCAVILGDVRIQGHVWRGDLGRVARS